MEHDLKQIAQALSRLHDGSRMDTCRLFQGIELSFLTFKSAQLTLRHTALPHILGIHYCKAGRIGWTMGNGNSVYLGPGDYCLHTMDVCAHSVLTLPNEFYEGLALCIDLPALSHAAPALLEGARITGEFLAEKFCRRGNFASFAGTAQTASIFSGFYEQPEAFRLPYWKLKTLELLLYLGKRKVAANEPLTAYQAEQVEIIRAVHQQLAENLDRHFTIASLAKQFLINPTTLKTVFKAVYGNSIAAHTREHRLEQAANRLLATQDSISAIAQAVGYENQSKFTAAFKAYYQQLPTEYRKNHQT